MALREVEVVRGKSRAEILTDTATGEVHCAHCREPFEQHRWNQRYCTTPCKAAAGREEWEAVKRHRARVARRGQPRPLRVEVRGTATIAAIDAWRSANRDENGPLIERAEAVRRMLAEAYPELHRKVGARCS